jgi:two-component system, sensor histidine kinase RegB
MPLNSDTTNRKNVLLLIQLRWIAVTGQIVTIAVVHFGLGIALPLDSMALVLGALVALNLVSFLWLRHRIEVSRGALFLALALDVAALTAQLYFSGGATNPFTALYLLQVTLAAALVGSRLSWTLAVIALLCYIGLIQFSQPLQLGPENSDLFRLYIIGALACFALNAGLLVFFLTRIARNLRTRDARLAELKQREAEEDHIVRMGLLASGAAHELGTPLASVAVILGDWRRIPQIQQDPELSQDIDEMQAAVQRCKSIVSGILQSSGEARGEAPRVTTVNRFVAEMVGEWSAARSAAKLHYENRFGEDVAIVADSTLKQVVFNLLDNAFEASPKWIGLTAERQGATLVLRVSDSGPGFTPEMIAQFGKPYRSTKGRTGGGLGLFLVVNVVRKLGGSVSAQNRPEGGAVVTVNLPLDTLEIETHGHVE